MFIVSIFFVLAPVLNIVIYESQANDLCQLQQNNFESIIKNEKALDVFYFVNDTKETIQLTWAGENSGVLILVTMTEGEMGPGLISDIYRSDNNGKTFVKITQQLGENVYIRRENGLQRHQNQRDSKELFIICYDIEDITKSIIFVTKDGGYSWKRSHVPFVLSGQLRFYPRERLYPWVLTLEEKTLFLYLSLDNGNSWRKIHSDVVDYFWSIYHCDPKETIYVLFQTNGSKNGSERHTLVKSSDFGQSWTHLLDNVIRVWAPRGVKADIPQIHDNKKFTFEKSEIPYQDNIKLGQFLYVSHFSDSQNQTAQLSVSTDGGKTFEKVYLPTIQPERFYSVLEVEDNSAFIHVDAPNDTGYGALYISDITGTIFSESLRQHLYPNHAPVTDFYRVASMRGTYLATRLNPDRTLHTVITHSRGASWHALGVPQNVLEACQTKVMTTSNPSVTTTETSGNLPTQSSKTITLNSTISMINQVTDVSELNKNQIINNLPNEIWRPDPNINESNSSDPSAVKICGLQISNQFSIKNRVIASPPLSIAAAPGLILAHGHVATHLKNTPADVFVSSDGGYTWLKALDGPHHYQIANRGGLLVAVPAETLWPDILRFSTDEGRCWHTIPLRTGQWSTTNNPNSDLKSPSNANETTATTKSIPTSTTSTPIPPTITSAYVEILSLTTSELVNSLESSIGKQKMNNLNASSEHFPSEDSVSDSISESNGNHDNWSGSRTDETVVFTGLVTEPGGRAMAAAVYGYGTITQRWRVAVVDFRSNGMITKKCTEEDYELWTPHSTEPGEIDGCLLGIREKLKRLKKDSLCINEYGMETRVEIEVCPCTQADYECEYGYYRQSGSLDCIRNPHIPLIDPCSLSKYERQNIHELGYRRIPGDYCVGGWQPPVWNQTIVHLLKLCPNDHESSISSRSVSAIVILSLILSSVVIACLWIRCRYHHTNRSIYFPNQLSSRLQPTTNRIRNWFLPILWKRSTNLTIPLDGSSYNDSQTILWPPINTTNWDSFDVNHHNYKRTSTTNTTISNNNNNNNNFNNNNNHNRSSILPNIKNYFQPLTNKFTRPLQSHLLPSFTNRSNLDQQTSDITNLLDAEEINPTTSIQDSNLSNKTNSNSDISLLYDPLASGSSNINNEKYSLSKSPNGRLNNRETKNKSEQVENSFTLFNPTKS